MTPNGNKPIEEFREGDLVLARKEDCPNGQVLARPVEAVFAGEGYVLELHVAGRMIRTTSEHPFWVKEKGWLPANQLAAGDMLLTHDYGQIAVERVVQTSEYTRVYNIRVSEYHTYFVGHAEWDFSVWSHNACYRARSQGSGMSAIEVTQRNAGADTWIMLNGARRLYSTREANALARELTSLSRLGLHGGNRLTVDCSKWARVYTDDVAGDMHHIYSVVPGFPQQAGVLPGEDPPGGPYSYHTLALVGDTLFDQLNPHGYTRASWIDTFRELNGHPVPMTPEEFAAEFYFGPTPPSRTVPAVT